MNPEVNSGQAGASTAQTVLAAVAAAAQDRLPVSGWTHNFYRYPARFSPRFAAAVIEHFSKPGDLMLDPYMGGGTSVVEGMAAGRLVVGNDLNSLATFIAKVKTTPLSEAEAQHIGSWLKDQVPAFSYRIPRERLEPFVDESKTRNMSLPRARFIKKAIAIALRSISKFPTANSRDFAKCVVLRVGQGALDGRSRHTPLAKFREQIAETALEMLDAIQELAAQAETSRGRVVLFNQDASELSRLSFFAQKRVSLVLTSPPYPGVHVLYHRWQVDGRRETPAPYWITGCSDGQGAAFYNFGDRRQAAADNYFKNSLATLRGIRKVMKDGAYMVQLVAFNRPEEQLTRYLENMQVAGFAEATAFAENRIWREVPNRKWHARLRGQTGSAREVVLVHQAV